jgi:hypothetical protein
VPCSTQVAVQPAGTTCTFIRRPQSGQYRGGSNRRAAAHAVWSPSAATRPQRSQ